MEEECYENLEFALHDSLLHAPIIMWLYTFFDEICRRSLKFLKKCVFSDVVAVQYTQWLTMLFRTGGTIHPLAVTCYSV